jgi:carbon storage regulator
MLVISRQLSQTIMIGDDIKLTVVRIGQQHVRIGIDAPKHMPIHRQEIYDAIKAASSDCTTEGNE